MLHAGRAAGVDDVNALCVLGGLGQVFPVVGYCENAVGGGDCLGDGGGVVEVGYGQVDASLGEGDGVGFAGVPGYGAEGVLGGEVGGGEDRVDYGTALVAGCAEDGEEFLDDIVGVAWVVVGLMGEVESVGLID